jgi:hypothetical protein
MDLRPCRGPRAREDRPLQIKKSVDATLRIGGQKNNETLE